MFREKEKYEINPSPRPTLKHLEALGGLVVCGEPRFNKLKISLHMWFVKLRYLKSIRVRPMLGSFVLLFCLSHFISGRLVQQLGSCA